MNLPQEKVSNVRKIYVKVFMKMSLVIVKNILSNLNIEKVKQTMAHAYDGMLFGT